MFLHTNPLSPLTLETTTIKGQRWYRTPNDNLYPSITTILGSEEKQYLKDWRSMLGENKANQETKRCADRGSAVHLMAEKFLQNDENATHKHTTDNIKLFNQLKFVLKRINNIRAQEIALYSDVYEMAGRCDCIAEFDGVLSIIDFKTANNNKTAGMIEDYFIQTSGYAVMCNEQYGTDIRNVVVLIAVEKGMLPQVFKQQVDVHLPLLQKRINNFYDKL